MESKRIKHPNLHIMNPYINDFGENHKGKETINLIIPIILLLIITFSIYLKINYLQLRPVYHDESVFKVICDGLKTRTYKYEPEFHGIINVVLTNIGIYFFGDTLTGLRGMQLILSILTLFLPLFLWNKIDTKALIVFIILLSLSPILNYYSSFAYFESFFVFFYFIYLFAIFLFLRMTLGIDGKSEGKESLKKGDYDSLYLIAITTPILLGINEAMYVIVAMSVLSFLLLMLIDYRFKRRTKGFIRSNKRVLTKHIIIATIIFLSLMLFIFSSFMTENPIHNIKESITYNLFYKSNHTGHNKPFFYYTKVLFIDTPTVILFIILSSILLISRFKRGKKSHSKDESKSLSSVISLFFVLLTILIWFVISLVPYKTPWNVLFVLTPLIFSVVLLFDDIIRERIKGVKLKNMEFLLVIIGIFLLLTTNRILFVDYANPKTNLLSYGQTLPEFEIGMNKIYWSYPSVGAIVTPDPHPAAWYLRFYNIHYYNNIDMLPNRTMLLDYDFLLLDKDNYKKLIRDYYLRQEMTNQGYKEYELRICPGISMFLFLREN